MRIVMEKSSSSSISFSFTPPSNLSDTQLVVIIYVVVNSNTIKQQLAKYIFYLEGLFILGVVYKYRLN